MPGLQSSYDPMSIFQPTPVPTPNLQPLYPDTGSQSVSVGYPVQKTAPGTILGNNTSPTNNNPAPAPAPSNNGGIPAVDMSFYPGWTDQGAINADWANTWQQKTGGSSGGGTADPYAGLRGEINSGYDSYIQSLNDQLGGLTGQRGSQEQMVDNQLSMGMGDIGLQQQQGEQQFANQRGEVATNQSKNLKSIDENLRNMFMAGNVYLGSRGAGDSSAANQYSYALTKQGNQARGDQMSQATKAISEIQDRETNLKNIVDNETNKLKTEADNKKIQISQWFADAQQQIKSAIGSGQLNRSTDLANLSKSILDQGIAALQKVQDNYTSQQNSLMTWAQNNSTNINQLKSNIQQAMAITPSLASPATMSGAISTDAQGNATMNPLIGYGNTSEKKGLFG